MRRQRAALTPKVQRLYAQQMLQQLRKQRIFRSARHIALYLPVRGEADPRDLKKYAWPHQKFYLPVLSPLPNEGLWFIHWHQHTCFRLNCFRIPEPYPQHCHQRGVRQLDLVIMPLVAFDQSGNRLGMGGGFYDRTFAFKRLQTYHPRPYLVGYAYAFQQVALLQSQPWDVPLDAVVTESAYTPFNR